MKILTICLISAACMPAGIALEPELWLIASPTDLGQVAGSLARLHQSVMPAYEDLERDARKLLERSRFSVTDKKATGASGDRHDYLSLDSSWWPDSGKSDGLPYVRRIGAPNPAAKETEFSDAERLRHFADAMETLGLVWYYQREEIYATKGAEFLRAWFLDETTRMNPHLKYAQSVPGVHSGQEEGILEGRHFIRVMQAALWLITSEAWTDGDHAALQDWFRAYLNWLETSPQGRDERNANSNHGSWYDTQTAAVALFVGETERARDILNRLRTRWAIQFLPNGDQPFEQSRADSLHDSVFNLLAHLTAAQLGRHTGLDLWGDPASPMESALRRVLPSLSGREPWPHRQERDLDSDYVLHLVRLAEGFLDHELPEDEMPAIRDDDNCTKSRWQILLPGR